MLSKKMFPEIEILAYLDDITLQGDDPADMDDTGLGRQCFGLKGEKDGEAQPSYLVPSHVDLGKAALSDLLVNNKLADVAAARLARAA